MVEKHRAVWGEVGLVIPQEPKYFMGTPGPTYVDEKGGTRGQREALLAQKATKLFFFKKFFDSECMDCIVGW